MSAELKSFISSSFCRWKFLPNLKADLLSVPRQLDVVDGSRTVVLKIIHGRMGWGPKYLETCLWRVSCKLVTNCARSKVGLKNRWVEGKFAGRKAFLGWEPVRMHVARVQQGHATSDVITWPHFAEPDYLLLPLTLRALSLSWVRFPRIGSEQRHQCFAGDEWSLL